MNRGEGPERRGSHLFEQAIGLLIGEAAFRNDTVSDLLEGAHEDGGLIASSDPLSGPSADLYLHEPGIEKMSAQMEP